jgi:hypothetical protein
MIYGVLRSCHNDGLTRNFDASRINARRLSQACAKLGDADPKALTLRAIQAALESAGVIFVEDDRGEGVVRLRSEPTSNVSV